MLHSQVVSNMFRFSYLTGLFNGSFSCHLLESLVCLWLQETTWWFEAGNLIDHQLGHGSLEATRSRCIQWLILGDDLTKFHISWQTVDAVALAEHLRNKEMSKVREPKVFVSMFTKSARFKSFERPNKNLV